MTLSNASDIDHLRQRLRNAFAEAAKDGNLDRCLEATAAADDEAIESRRRSSSSRCQQSESRPVSERKGEQELRTGDLRLDDRVRVHSKSLGVDGNGMWVNATVVDDGNQDFVRVEFQSRDHYYSKKILKNSKNLFIPCSTRTRGELFVKVPQSMIPPPKLNGADWRSLQMFSMKRDDPYKLEQPWTPPAWVATTSPKSGVSKAFLVEHDVKHLGQNQTRSCLYNGFKKATSLWTIDRFLSPEHCIDLLEVVNEKGYMPALTNIGGMVNRPGGDDLQFNTERRNLYISMIKSEALATWMYERAEPFLRRFPVPEGVRLDHINPALRFLCYKEGQKEVPRFDGMFRYPKGQAPEGMEEAQSAVTMVLYLKDVSEKSGGSNLFFRQGPQGESQRGTHVQPEMGRLVIFSQNLWHASKEMLNDSIKYAIRMEVMAVPTDKVLPEQVAPDSEPEMPDSTFP